MGGMIMDINAITSSTVLTENKTYSKETSDSKKSDKNARQQTDCFEKSAKPSSDSTKQIYKKNPDIIKKLQDDLENRKKQLENLISTTLHGQANASMKLCDIFEKIKDGTFSVDPKAVEQAKKDVADDGYWGVEQTSDRFVEFAKALSGGDPDKADMLMDAVRKGFDQATKEWGGKLPDICQRTIDATAKKFEEWKNSKNTSNSNAE